VGAKPSEVIVPWLAGIEITHPFATGSVPDAVRAAEDRLLVA
jgi:hypothetical protein